MPKRKPLSLTNLLRQELAAAPSVNAIAKAIGVTQPSLCRFLNGDADYLTFETASRLLDYFGYVVAKPAAPSRPKAKRPAAKQAPTKRRTAKR